MTLPEAIEGFLTALAANGRSPSTISCYRRDLKRFAEQVGLVAVSTLTFEHVHYFVLSEAVQLTDAGMPRQPISIGRMKAALKSFGRYLTIHGLIDRDPTAGLEIRRFGRLRPRALTDSERRRLEKALTDRIGPGIERDRAMLAVFLGTGVRLQELANLNVGDIRLDERRIVVQVKGGRTHLRLVNDRLARALRRYLRNVTVAEAPLSPLFVSARGCRISTRQIQTRFHQWLDWAGIDRPGLSVHSLRHTFGTRVYSQSRDLLLTARAMGHACLESTRVYVDLCDADLAEALEAI